MANTCNDSVRLSANRSACKSLLASHNKKKLPFFTNFHFFLQQQMLLDWTRNLDRFAIEHRPPPTQTEPTFPHLYRLGHIPKQGVFVIAQDPPSRLLASPDHESVRIARPGARPLVCAPSTHLAALCRRFCSHRHTPRTFACVAANPLPRARPIAGWPHAFPRSASRPRVSGARDNTARARGRLPLNPFSVFL